MNIIGPDALVFGVDDVAACRQYLIDYGLKECGDGYFEALDGTGVTIRAKDDPSLPPAMPTASMLRETVYGVADAATLDAIEAELKKDREVSRSDGVLRSVDDMGFAARLPGHRAAAARSACGIGQRAGGAAAARSRTCSALTPDMAALPRSLVACGVFRSRYRQGRSLLCASRLHLHRPLRRRRVPSCARPERRITTRCS